MVAGLPLQRSSRRHGAPTDRAMFAAAPRCEAEADARCVLVSAAGTLMESACRQAPNTTHLPSSGLPLQGSTRHGAPTDRASLWLL